MRLITAKDITAWANDRSRNCQGMLPLLVRRLIRATAAHVNRIDIPGDDAVSDEGWDGRLTCTSSSPHLPDGVSGWEIGTNQKVGEKAEDDYEKRSTDPLDLDPAATTYVFVTPRSWQKKHAWAAEKRAEGRWRDVRVIAAGDLEQWLEEAPAVALWLAQHLGRVPTTGFSGLEQWWSRWANGTRPAITPAMVIAGRDHEVAATRSWIEGPAGCLEVQADAPDEAIAFLHAVAAQGPDATREALLARCVVVTSEEAFTAAAAWPSGLVIVADADHAQAAAGEALHRGHHLCLAVGATLAGRSEGRLRLPRLDGFALQQALVATDMSREEAVSVVAACGRSLTVFHRRRAPIQTVRRPPWASDRSREALIPALLAGAWSEVVRSDQPTPFGPALPPLQDRVVLSRLAGNDYAEITKAVRHTCAGDDPPLRKAADIWRLTAPLDAWYLLHDRVEQHHLERLGEVAVDVLAAVDPKYDLPEQQQWTAALHGKLRPHSRWLRQGVSTSLAIVAHHGEQLRLPIPYGTTSGFIGHVVERVLRDLAGWQGWASIGDQLPFLAEAAPEAVLSAIEDFIADRPADVRALLTDGGDGMTGECRHAGMLWALERLAWHPDHLERCLRLLARLDGLDPDGRWANRPFPAICDILLGPGDPHTYADVPVCLTAVDGLIAEAPQLAWRMLLRAANPSQSRMVRDPPIYLPARPDGWRPWNGEARRTFLQGMRERLHGLIETGDGSRVVQALGKIELLPSEAQVAIVTRLSGEDISMGQEESNAVWPAVRGVLHRVRSDGWGRPLAPGVEDALERTYHRLAPTDPLARVGWLFQEAHPRLADGQRKNWEEHWHTLEQRRAEAVRDLLPAMDVAELLTWAEGLVDAHAFGIVLAAVVDVVADADLAVPMLSLAQVGRDRVPPLLLAYGRRKLDILGPAWFARWLGTAAELPEPVAAQAALLCMLPSTAETWRQVEALGPAVEQLYWKWSWGQPEGTVPAEDWAHAIDRLLAAGRTGVALRCVLGSDLPVLPGPLLVRLASAVLGELAASHGETGPNLLWELEQLFEQIDRATDLPQAEAAVLEWEFLPLLSHARRGPRVLHRMLASDAALFAQMIRWAYKRRDGAAEPEDDIPHVKRRDFANRAEQLLSSWKGPFSEDRSSGLDEVALGAWVTEVRRLCAEADRAEVGDVRLGEMLAGSSNDLADGAWPHRAVRQVLGTARSEHLDSGFCSGVHDKRGVTCRGLRDGGALERMEADRYENWARKVRSTAPYAARLLGRIAEDYRAQAKWHDGEAEKNDLM